MTDVVVLIDREQGGAARMASNGLALHSAFTLTFILDVLVRRALVRLGRQHRVLHGLSAAAKPPLVRGRCAPFHCSQLGRAADAVRARMFALSAGPSPISLPNLLSALDKARISRCQPWGRIPVSAARRSGRRPCCAGAAGRCGSCNHCRGACPPGLPASCTAGVQEPPVHGPQQAAVVGRALRP